MAVQGNLVICDTHTQKERGHVVCALIPFDSRMVQSHNPLAVAVVALRGFWMVGTTSAQSEPKIPAAVPNADTLLNISSQDRGRSLLPVVTCSYFELLQRRERPVAVIIA